MRRYETSPGRGDWKIGYYDPRGSNRRLDVPRICNSSKVNPQVAQEALQSFYRITHFRLPPHYIQQCLDEQSWGALSPKDAIQHIDVDIPRFRLLKEPHMLDEPRFQLTALKTLKAGKAKIALTIASPKYQTMTHDAVGTAARRACKKTQRPMSQAWTTMMDEGIARDVKRLQEDMEWNVRVIMGVLLPDLADLINKDHSVTLKGKSPDWEYSLNAEHLTIDEMMKHWRKSVGKML